MVDSKTLNSHCQTTNDICPQFEATYHEYCNLTRMKPKNKNRRKKIMEARELALEQLYKDSSSKWKTNNRQFFSAEMENLEKEKNGICNLRIRMTKEEMMRIEAARDHIFAAWKEEDVCKRKDFSAQIQEAEREAEKYKDAERKKCVGAFRDFVDVLIEYDSGRLTEEEYELDLLRLEAAYPFFLVIKVFRAKCLKSLGKGLQSQKLFADVLEEISQKQILIEWDFLAKGFCLKDMKSRFKLFERASKGKGCPMAQYHLAKLYSKGLGCTRSDRKAVNWIRKAARNDEETIPFAKAMFEYGKLFLAGRGVTVSYQKAIQWFQKASKKRYFPATIQLAQMYIRGYGVKRDLSSAKQLLHESASQGHAESQYWMGEAYRLWDSTSEPQESSAETWFLKAAQNGHDLAVRRLQDIQQSPMKQSMQRYRPRSAIHRSRRNGCNFVF